ncbi:NAD(P)H-binding protein [Ligilactobacillus salivarius]|uniref:Oxidoreductase n=1 Tax=Ligilactobacillus salivarius TaxID=1624 RepID=A0A1D7TSC4_9LACO|nr:NAD(P)H-binding protein [Ligilactobacillus salivarius]AOO73855.1 oxidoreductase [Ligilactobacillus salivarius]UDE96560.1 NAD(P)H-binding protein [Ligilactobacillus salivarius]UUV95687.1 NAD(P)H-binding protein [Ligilactobacillus salivarius]
MNLLVLGAYGQIARLVEDRILKEDTNIKLTLFLRNSSRLNDLEKLPQVTVIDGDIENYADLTIAMKGQDMVYVATVDHSSNNIVTKNIIKAMKENNVSRVVFSNILGIYDEVPGEFGRWNYEMVSSGIKEAINSDKLLEESGLDYTTLRLPWLNDRDEVKYSLTHKNEKYVGVSGSRKSIADLVVRIAKNPNFLINDSVGVADPDTQGLDRPVY